MEGKTSKWLLVKQRYKDVLRGYWDVCNPEVYVQMLRNPTFRVFTLLKRRLKKSDRGWTEGFLNSGGLEVLLEAVDVFSCRRVTKIPETLRLLECVFCIERLVNSKLGISFLIENDSHIKKLVKALDTTDSLVKKHVFDLLSALCVYSTEGYRVTLEALDSYKTQKKQRYRFSLIANELKSAENIPYKTTLIAFVNCIIVSNGEVKDRVAVRNEFIGLNILDLISDLRNIDDEKLIIQCDVFDENKHADDEEISALNPACVDINSHREVFNAVFHKVYDTPLSGVFLNVLQTLLQFDPSKPISDVQWEIVEKSVKSAFRIDEKQAARGAVQDTRLEELPKYAGLSKSSQSPPSIVQPPRPPTPPPAPPPQSVAPSLEGTAASPKKPKIKMKTFYWTKVPAKIIISSENVWKEVEKMPDHIAVEFDTVKTLFCRKTIVTNEKKPKLKPPKEILLLGPKKSMNVNIFLKQFEESHSEIVRMIEEGDVTVIGPERLLGLQKILPDKDEVTTIKEFEGDKAKLGNAEKFYEQLIHLKEYDTRINGLCLKKEFQQEVDAILPNIDSVVNACQHLLHNKSFEVFLRYVLEIGNFMNAGGFAGDAKGFKISSLNKLMDTRANMPRVTLLHYLVEEAERSDQTALGFVEELSPDLTRASKFTMTDLAAEVKELKTSVEELKKNLKNCPTDVQNQLKTFAQEAKEKLTSLDEGLQRISKLTKQLAVYFCEEEKNFNIDECISNLSMFCDNIQRCQKENTDRKLQEEKAERRKKQKEALAKSTPRKTTRPIEQEEDNILDRLREEIKQGLPLRKTRGPPS
ncbi:inverted formin-2-like [Crassostrea virginica]